MLRHLRIQHLAVIETLEVDFEPGLTVLTGETGAGKSVLVDAIGLLLGGRASADLVRTGEDAAGVQGLFELPDGREVIIRREITSLGRSRAFIDDVLVTAGALKDFAGQLVDMHGQHDQQSLLDPDSHLDLLDQFGGLDGDRTAVAEAFERWRSASSRLERSHMDEREKAARLDLLSFQLGELERVGLKPDEDEALATERRVLASADKLSRLCAEGYEALYEGEGAALAQLNVVWRRVADLAAVDPAFAVHLAARDEMKARLEELAFAMREYADGIDASPERLQHVEDRLALVERLKRKYGPTLSDVIERERALRRDFDELRTASDRAAELQRAVETAQARYLEVAGRVSARRRQAADALAQDLIRSLASLALERTRAEFRLHRDTASPPPAEQWTSRGYDQAELFLSTNPGEDLRPLARVASGGELSRIMLALKTIVSTDVPGKTLIFDEVDAGVGGRVAEVVGRRLRQLGNRFQVLCITHLPQIAACAGSHLQVAKEVRGNRTITRIQPLTDVMRVESLAHMMAGTVTEAVRASAREMLAARRGESESAVGESEDVAKGESEGLPGKTGREKSAAKGKRRG